MPWLKSDLPEAAKNLTSKQKEIFVEVANSILEDTGDEEQAIRGGLSRAEEVVEKATTSDVERLDNGNIKYRGDIFPGFNKPMKDPGDKQGKVLAKKGDQIKVIRFGDPSMEDNQSKEQRDAFVARFSGQDGWDDPFSALYWSRKWLWPSDQRGTKEFHTVKSYNDVEKREFSQEQREKLAEEGKALPDGGFPIVTVEDLRNAVQAFGRADDKEKTARHIYDRAKALNAVDELPKDGQFARLAGIAQMDEKKSLVRAFERFLEKHFGETKKEYEGDYEGIAKAVNIEKQHFTAVVLRPDVPDLHGDIYSADVVEDACHSYNEVCRKANLQHLVQTDLATPIESYIAKSDFKLGNGEVRSGDWVMTMKIKDQELWEMCKAGKFTGFSVGCMASTEKIDD